MIRRFWGKTHVYEGAKPKNRLSETTCGLLIELARGCAWNLVWAVEELDSGISFLDPLIRGISALYLVCFWTKWAASAMDLRTRKRHFGFILISVGRFQSRSQRIKPIEVFARPP